MTPTVKTQVVRWTAFGSLAVLFLVSLHLAAHRIIQVDEAQNLFMARVIRAGQTDTYFANPALFLLGPLGWIVESAASSRDAFMAGRLLFLGVFWINIVLLIKCTGVSLRTKEGLIVVLAAASLAPLWDYGFEIRHDNLLLTGLLLIWFLGRHVGDRTASFFAIGAIACILQFIAFKAFAYTLPISMYFLLRRSLDDPTSSVKLLGAWIVGVTAGGLACIAVYYVYDLLPVFFDSVVALRASIETTNAFYPLRSLARLLTQTPLLVAIALAALMSLSAPLVKNPKRFLTQQDHAPEGVLLVLAVGVLFVNPTPFPYNLVNVVPFAFLLAYRFLAQVLRHSEAVSRPFALLAVSIVAISHIIPFVAATERHLELTNWRQMMLADTAEEMTDPARDRVYDAVGMVPTRHSIDRWWYLHSMSMRQVFDGTRTSVSSMLSQKPAAVLIPNYRFDWLPRSDWEYIVKHYLPLADDFWVLGAHLPPGGGVFHVLHPGRYQVQAEQNGSPVAGASIFVDDIPVGSDTLALTSGAHEITSSHGAPVTVLWLGPTLDSAPRIPAGNHRTLFRNWY